MISDLSRWEINMPMVMADPAFGQALLGILPYWGATSVLLADYVSGDRSILTDMIVNGADCVLQFDRLEFRGQAASSSGSPRAILWATGAIRLSRQSKTDGFTLRPMPPSCAKTRWGMSAQ
jgi:hypothetical protein